MPTLQEIADELNGFTAAQKARVNQTSTSKVYDESSQFMSQSDEDAADQMADNLNNLTDTEIVSLNALLDDENKASERPC